MKIILSSLLLIITLLFLTAEFSAKSQTCSSPASGIGGWWSGNDTTYNYIGTNFATLQGNAGYVNGKVGRAFTFDGSGDGVLIGNSPSFQLQNFTIEAWIKRASLAKASQAPGGGLFFSYGTDGYGFGMGDDGSLFLSKIDNSAVGTSVKIADTNFHHVALTKLNSQVIFYIDGTAYPASAYDPGFSFATPVAIGARGDLVGSFLGVIDELAFYNRPLSQSEIQAIFDSGSAGKCSPSFGPIITTQPESQTVVPGGDAFFSVSAVGSEPLSYQWRFNGVALSVATNSSLSIANVSTNHVGNYSVIVSQVSNVVTSTPAALNIDFSVCTPPPTNLVDWWTGNLNALGVSPPTSAFLTGNVTYVSGKVGQAFSFDGSGDAVVIGNSSRFQLQNFTIEAWIKRASLAKASQTFGGGLFFSYGSNGYGFGMGDDGSLFLSKIDNNNVATSVKITDTNFHHVALTKLNSQVIFYIDGAAYPAAAYNPGFTFATSVAIGARGDLAAGSFLGIIDELAFYNRVLGQSEIQVVFNSGAAGKCDFAPSIVAQPQSATLPVGTNVVLNAVAIGKPLPAFQWVFNNTNIPGATNFAIALTNVQPAQSGDYTVVITNNLGSITSAPAHLNVTYIFAFGNNQPLTNNPNTFVTSASIRLQTLFTNGSLFYTLNGSAPSFGSKQYTGPFLVNQSSVLRVITYSADFLQSYEVNPINLTIIPTYSLAATTSGGGVISLNPATGPYFGNTMVGVTATPNNGWTFLGWQGDADGTNTMISVVMNRNKRVQALFGTTFNTTTAGGGSVTLIPPGNLYPFGTVVRLYATPLAGNYFALWGNAASGSTNPLNFTLTSANPSVSALFAPLGAGQYSLTVIPDGLGQVSVSPLTNRYNSGQIVTLTATPDSGQRFNGWSGDATETNNPLAITMSQNKIISANFTRQPRLNLRAGLDGFNEQGFRFSLSGEFGSHYQIEGTTNLITWTNLVTLTNTFGTTQFTDGSATTIPFQFYRAVIAP